MRKKSDDLPTTAERLQYILDAISKIKNYTARYSIEDFLRDDRTQNAVLYNFIIIGEAIVTVPPEMLEKYPYTWYKVKAFRNFLAHEYFRTEKSVIWDTITIDIHEIEPIIKEIVEKEV